ncbi:hypothetical protein [Pontibacter ummariensis]|uniref:hypothetical protein n=1 Tax=Pontibacter ummariensis TaxID=1610492 RepID=UPI001185E561|nr:hypothetical protein [Pontibacter ummariensis]
MTTFYTLSLTFLLRKRWTILVSPSLPEGFISLLSLLYLALPTIPPFVTALRTAIVEPHTPTIIVYNKCFSTSQGRTGRG